MQLTQIEMSIDESGFVVATVSMTWPAVAGAFHVFHDGVRSQVGQTRGEGS